MYGLVVFKQAIIHRDPLLKLLTEQFLSAGTTSDTGHCAGGWDDESDRVVENNGTCYEGNEMSPTVN